MRPPGIEPGPLSSPFWFLIARNLAT